MTIIGDEIRRIQSANGHSPEQTKEAARRVLPEAARVVNKAWVALNEDPKNERLRKAHFDAARIYSTIEDLAEG